MALSELEAFSGVHVCAVTYPACCITNILHGVDLAWTPKTSSKSTPLCLPRELSAVLCHCSRIAVGSHWHPEPILSWYKRPKIESTDSNFQQVEVDFTLGEGVYSIVCDQEELTPYHDVMMTSGCSKDAHLWWPGGSE